MVNPSIGAQAAWYHPAGHDELANFEPCFASLGLPQMVAVEPASPAQYDEWKAYLAACKSPTAFLEPAWLRVLEGAYPCAPRLFIARETGGTIQGGALVYHHTDLHHTLHSPPFGLAVSAPEIVPPLFDALRQYAAHHGITASNLALGFEEHGPGGTRGWTRPSFMLPLGKDGEAFWQALPSKARNTIRKAQKQDLTISFGRAHLEAWYQIYAEQCLAKRLTIHNQRYFELLFDEFGGRAVLVTGLQKGEVTAGMVFLYGQPFGHYLFNASRPEALRSGANSLLMLEIADDARAAGVTDFELGESRPGSGVYDFKKKQMGGEETAIHHVDLFSEPAAPRASLKERIHYSARFIWPLLPALAKRHNLRELKALHRLI